MRYQVKRKQPNSKMCLVCGMKNPFGLRSFFYELEHDNLLAVFTPKEEHQGYPGRLHGGIAAAILDETIGRTIMTRYDEDIWGVTMEFRSRYKKPVPLDQTLRVISRVTKETGRMFEGTGEILLNDGSVAVEGYGKYLKLPITDIADFDVEEQEWRVVPAPSDIDSVEM